MTLKELNNVGNLWSNINIVKFMDILLVLTIYFVKYSFGQGPDCTGQIVGVSNPNVSATPGSYTGYSYALMDGSMKIPCCGVISEWRFATSAAGDLTTQVWRQQTGTNYKVIGETAMNGLAAGSTTWYSVATSIQTSVQQDDIIGWYSSAKDIVPYTTDAAVSMGRVAHAGKTALNGASVWPSSGANGERWEFGAVLSPDSAPTFSTSLPAIVTAKMSDPVGTSLYTITIADNNPNDVAALTVAIKPVSANFQLSGYDVKILSALSVGTYKVPFEVVDHCLKTGTGTLTVMVVDDKPKITSLPVAAALLAEDYTGEVLLHMLTFTDDGPLKNVKCSIQSRTPTPSPFELKYASGASNYCVSYVPDPAMPLNYDVTPLYSMQIVCNDGVSDSDPKEFQVSIKPNLPPVPKIPTEITVSAKETKNGTLVYTVESTDVENDPRIYRMSCTCPFEMYPNGEIHATKDLNDLHVSPFVAEINVTDPYNNVGPTTMTIKIKDINTPPNITNPTLKLPNVDTVYLKEHTKEGIPNLIGTTVSVFNAAGYDLDSDNLAYEITFKNGQGEDLYTYNTNTGKITTKTNIDYETLSKNGLLTTRVSVRAFDGREYSETRDLNIVVEDVNETPIFNQNKYSIDASETTSITSTLACPLFDVTDPDLYDTRTYDINCGTAGQFHIPNARTATCDAFVEQTAEYDLDKPGAASKVVSCVVKVTDKGGLTATTTLEITVHEEDDNPPVLDQTSYTYTISNDTTAGAKFGGAKATDIDFLPEHRRLTYSTDSSDFGVDNNGVFYSKKDWTGVNAPTSRTFNLQVTDAAGHTDTAPVTVFIIDIPPTTTTSTTTTTLPSVYSKIGSFMDEPGNLGWLIPAVILGALAAGLGAFMMYKCCANGCAGFKNICRGGRCFNGPRRVRGNLGKTVVRRINPPEERLPPRQTPTRTVVRKVQPKEKSSSMFDCFKSKPKLIDKPVAEPKTWHLWNHTDFQSPQKWVG